MRRCWHLPWRNHVHATAVIVSRTTECMHDPSSAPFRTLILHATRTVKERSAGADEGETGVDLKRSGSIGAVLFDERMKGEFRGVQRAMKIHLHCFEIGRLRRVLRTWRLSGQFLRGNCGSRMMYHRKRIPRHQWRCRRWQRRDRSFLRVSLPLLCERG
jgi:hypothetical protein